MNFQQNKDINNERISYYKSDFNFKGVNLIAEAKTIKIGYVVLCLGLWLRCGCLWDGVGC